MKYRVGVDIGGTFTDFVVMDENHEVLTLKVPSAPDAPGSEIVAGLRRIEDLYGVSPADIGYFTHGLTIGINTLIQRKGSRLALITNEGFEDILELGRLRVPEVFSLFSKRAAPLIAREDVHGVPGRMASDGAVSEALNSRAVEEAVSAARDAGVDGLVIAFLNSYRDPAQERAARDIAARIAPDLPVTCSAEVWPIIREFERTTTAVIDAYVRDKVAGYLGSLQLALAELGVVPAPLVSKSNGGVMSAAAARESGIDILLSGTAAGVNGAAYVASMAGLPRVASLDIGGTSADVAVIVDGRPEYGAGQLVGDFTLSVPAVLVSSIGAGGGSIAWVDDQGVIRCGPESAGSVPGPVCYGRGGDRPTITDAFVTCGFLGRGELGYSAVPIDRDAARNAIADLGRRVGLGPEDAAEGIIRVAVSGMFAEISKIFARQGAEPGSFTLLPFGGAGPMMACFVAREMGVRSLLIPPAPGVLSALGGLVADTTGDFVRTVFCDLTETELPLIARGLEGLNADAATWLEATKPGAEVTRLSFSADMRYAGQSFEIETPFDAGAVANGDLQSMRDAFHALHARLYGHADVDAPVQVISLRCVISSENPKPRPIATEERPRRAEPSATVEVYYEGTWRTAGIYDRADLTPGATVEGPAIIHQPDTTTCMLHGFRARVDRFSNLILETGHVNAGRTNRRIEEQSA